MEGFDSAGLKVNRFGWGGDDWSASVSLALPEASKAAVGKRGRLRSSQAPLLLSHSRVRLSSLGTATAMPTARPAVNSFESGVDKRITAKPGEFLVREGRAGTDYARPGAAIGLNSCGKTPQLFGFSVRTPPACLRAKLHRTARRRRA